MIKFAYEPITQILESELSMVTKNKAEIESVMLPLLSALKQVSSQMIPPEMIQALKDIVALSVSQLSDDQPLKAQVLEINHVLESPLAISLWLGLEHAKRIRNRPEREREYTNFQNQTFSHIGILILFLRLFGGEIHQEMSDYLEHVKENMRSKTIAKLDAEHVRNLIDGLRSQVASLIHGYTKNGELSSAKLLYEIFIGVEESLISLHHRIGVYLCLQQIEEMVRHEKVRPPTILQNQDDIWFHENLPYQEIERESVTLHEPRILKISDSIMSLMDELSENLDLVYRAKGVIEQEETADLLQFIREMLRSSLHTNRGKKDFIMERTALWKKRMMAANCDSHDLIVEEILRLVAEITTEEKLNA